MSLCQFVYENAEAEVISRNVLSVLSETKIQFCGKFVVGSLEFIFLHEWEPSEPIYCLFKLGEVATVFYRAPGDELDVRKVLRHYALRKTRNTIWPDTKIEGPKFVQPFTYSSPMQKWQLGTFVLRAINGVSESGEEHTQIFSLDLDNGTVTTESLALNLFRERRQCEYPEEEGNGADYSADRHRALDDVARNIYFKLTAPGLGIVSRPAKDLDAPVASVNAKLKIEGLEEIITLGRGKQYQHAFYVCVLEGVERLAGLTSINYAELWSARADEIESKITPESVGLHLQDYYQRDDFAYPAYEPGMELEWVWGQSITTGKKVAVPACFAFYGGTKDRPKMRLVAENSNGCALGTSVEEASLHAIFELVERDAVLMTWYQERSLKDITQVLLKDNTVRWTLSQIEMITGMRIKVLDSTMEHGIPSVICIATGDSLPRNLISSGSGLHYTDAAVAALSELGGHCLFLLQRFQDAAVIKHAYKLFETPELTMGMEDHGYVNALPESSKYFDFLNGSVPVEESELLTETPFYGSTSVRESLDIAVKQLERQGHDVVIVAQDIPLLKSLGLSCVKAVCPGLLPMTFGHVHRRVNLPRLGNATQQEIAATRPPHPFM